MKTAKRKHFRSKEEEVLAINTHYCMLLSPNANKSRSSPDHFASAADENTCDTSIAKIQTILLRESDPLKLKSEQNKKVSALCREQL